LRRDVVTWFRMLVRGPGGGDGFCHGVQLVDRMTHPSRLVTDRWSFGIGR
jgi:hypothetical protein